MADAEEAVPDVITSANTTSQRLRTETLDPETKRKRYGAVTTLIVAFTSLLVSISLAIPALIASREAKDSAAHAVEKGQENAEVAKVAADTAIGAKRTTDAAYDVTVEKVNPLAEDVRKLREDLNVLLEERAQRAQLVAPSKRPEVVTPKPVSPEGGEPLPAAPPAAGGI